MKEKWWEKLEGEKKYLAFKRANTRFTYDFLSETMQVRKIWNEIFKCWKKNSTSLDSVKLSLKIKELNFLRQTKIEEISFSRSDLWGLLREVILQIRNLYRSQTQIYIRKVSVIFLILWAGAGELVVLEIKTRGFHKLGTFSTTELGPVAFLLYQIKSN
jgi:hypothetical protein